MSNAISQSHRLSDAESESRPATEPPIPNVRIIVDVPPGMARGPRLMSVTDIAEESAWAVAHATEDVGEAAEVPELPLSAPAPHSSEALLEAANAVRDKGTEIDGIVARIAEMSEKSRDLDGLRTTLASVREERIQLIGAAMVDGRPADTTAIDKRCVKATLAFDKQRDEITAIERALEILQTQRNRALCELTECSLVYESARDEHVRSISLADKLILRFHEATAEARFALTALPDNFRQRLSAMVNLESAQLPGLVAVQEALMSQAKADLIAAEELSAKTPPEAPKCLGYVWSDGFIYQEPQPAPDVRHLVLGHSHVGFVTPAG